MYHCSFNVAGRDRSGYLMNDVHVDSGSLFSQLHNVLSGSKDFLLIYGNDWGTKDGTCIRDYIHVSDLSRGHISAINLMNISSNSFTINFGTGIGSSVLDIVSLCELVTGKRIDYSFESKRPGEVGVSYSDISLAKKVFGWHPNKTLIDICADSFGTFRP